MAFEVGKCLILDRLEKIGMTQQQLANKTGLSRHQISDYVTGRKILGVRNLRLFSHVLDCHMEDLYEWIEVPPKRSRVRNNQEKDG